MECRPAVLADKMRSMKVNMSPNQRAVHKMRGRSIKCQLRAVLNMHTRTCMCGTPLLIGQRSFS